MANESLKSQLETKTKEFESQQQQLQSKLDEIYNEKENLEIQLRNYQKQLEKLEPTKNSAQLESTPNETNHKLKILDSELLKEYEKMEQIGIGSSGQVVKVAKKIFYALKIMSTENATVENLRQFLNEYEIMNLLNHPNILKAFGVFLSDEKSLPSILLEYCQTNLAAVIKNKSFSNVQLICAIYQIAEGMRYIHFNKIIHRDLKPTNILVTSDGTIKISDFGISKLMTPEELTMTIGVGTNKFMAPEIIAEEDNFNEKVDVYSFGVLVYYSLSGGELPKIKTPQILQGKKAEIPSSFTKFAKELIDSCWEFEAENRPSFNEICQKLQANHYNLMNISNGETNEVEIFVQNHQKRLPKYGQ